MSRQWVGPDGTAVYETGSRQWVGSGSTAVNENSPRHEYSLMLTGSTAPAASIGRGIGKRLTASNSPIGTVARAIAHALLATTSPSARLVKGAAKVLPVTTSPAASVVKGAGHALPATTSPSASTSRTAGKYVTASATMAASIGRALGHSVLAVTNPAAGLVRALGKRLMGATSPAALLARNAGKPLLVTTSPAATMAKGVLQFSLATTAPVAFVNRSLGVFVRALAFVSPALASRFFHLPDECSIIVLPAQETVIMFETCELKTGQFPARYTPESRLYGVDFSRRLDGSEVIDVPDVSLMEGDIVISDVYNNDSVVTFRLTGGSPVYQRLAIRVTTTATPPNIYQGEATIACYP